MNERTNDEPAGGARCDYDFTREHLEAAWMTFQETGEATCPETDAPFEVALADDPADDGVAVARIRVRCERCGRRAGFAPDSTGVVAWEE